MTWPSLFLHGAGVTLLWAPVSVDSRKMDGAEDCGMGSLLLWRLVHLPQGLGEMALQSTSAPWLQMQRLYPDQHLLIDGKSRALETSLLKWLCIKYLFPPCGMELISVTDHHGNDGRSLVEQF